MPDIDTIRSKLDRLRAADRGLTAFGATTHRYVFASPVTANELRVFEKRHAVRLPGEYRTFLTELGNGGAGPFYGIFPLGLFDGSGGAAEPWEGLEGIVGRLDQPFPLRDAWNLAASRFEPPGEFASDDEEDRWYAELDATCWRSDLVNGAFPICHHGCALRTYLVVSGAERGNVWFDRRSENGGIQPHSDGVRRHMTFLGWYELWLDESLRAIGAA